MTIKTVHKDQFIATGFYNNFDIPIVFSITLKNDATFFNLINYLNQHTLIDIKKQFVQEWRNK